MTMAAIVWIVAAVVFGVLEAATTALVTIWFAIAACVAAVAAQLGASTVAQAGIFIAASAVLLIATRPVLKKISVKSPQRTNADRLIGVRAVVTEEINNTEGKGLVMVSGALWSAVSSGGEKISKGTEVEVLEISGVKLVVKPVTPSNNNE